MLAGVVAAAPLDAQVPRDDLLLRKLVEKGILTQTEADQMKAEAERERAEATEARAAAIRERKEVGIIAN